MRFFKKPKITDKDLEKVNLTINEIKECQNCKQLKEEIKKCAEQHNTKDNLRSVTSHIIKCSNCRDNILLITQCKRNGHI